MSTIILNAISPSQTRDGVAVERIADSTFVINQLLMRNNKYSTTIAKLSYNMVEHTYAAMKFSKPTLGWKHQIPRDS